MLELKDNKLIGSINTISEMNTVIKIASDKEQYVKGVVTYTDGTQQSLDVSYYKGYFRASLFLQKKNLNNISNAKFHLVIYNEAFSETTNAINLTFDKTKLNTAIAEAESDEITKLKIELSQMQLIINRLMNNEIIKDVKVVNNDSIEKGMVLVSIGGNAFIAAKPFANTVKKINGVEAVDGVVEINSSVIEYKKDVTVEDYLGKLADAVKSTYDTIKALEERISSVSKKLDNLIIDFNRHVNNGII